PSATHGLSLRYRATRPEAGTTLMGLLSLSATRDYVGTAEVLAGGDTAPVRGITLEPGARLTYPVNLDGYWSARSFVTYGRPVGVLRSNANASLGVTSTRTPGLIGGAENRADAVGFDGRLFLGSNVSERLDFSLSYGLGYTTVA